MKNILRCHLISLCLSENNYSSILTGSSTKKTSRQQENIMELILTFLKFYNGTFEYAHASLKTNWYAFLYHNVSQLQLGNIISSRRTVQLNFFSLCR